MADPVSGHGGTIKITGESTDPKVGSWELEKMAVLADTTDASRSGWEHRTKVRKGGRLTAEIFWDSAANAEDLSLDAGDTFEADLKLGDAAYHYADVDFIVETCTVTGCDQQGVVRFRVVAYAQGAIPDPSAIV
jgi:hypothetical protein